MAKGAASNTIVPVDLAPLWSILGETLCGIDQVIAKGFLSERRPGSGSGNGHANNAMVGSKCKVKEHQSAKPLPSDPMRSAIPPSVSELVYGVPFFPFAIDRRRLQLDLLEVRRNKKKHASVSGTLATVR